MLEIGVIGWEIIKKGFKKGPPTLHKEKQERKGFRSMIASSQFSNLQLQICNLATWQLGNLTIWQLGNLTIWQLGILAFWQLGNLAT